MEVTWKELINGKKRNSDMIEKKNNAHRLAFALWQKSADDLRTLARELHYEPRQLRIDMVDLIHFIWEIESELKES